MGNNSYHLEMRFNSYPTCDLGLLIRGITLSIGIPYEINVRIDYRSLTPISMALTGWTN